MEPRIDAYPLRSLDDELHPRARLRLIDSESLRRGYRRAKSGSLGGMGRTFSVRLNFRAPSSALPWSRTVMVWES